jgi:hypothetical protein
MQQIPTYQQFKELAQSQGWSVGFIAQHTQADNPTKTAERILYHLAGTRWDSEPLPYPKLCQLYHGTKETASAAPTPRPPVELTAALVAGRRDRPWLKPGQFIVQHRFTDPYLDVTLAPDAPREGIETLAHLAGALRLDADTYRFPYEVLCRLAGQQCRSLGDHRAKGMAPITPKAPDTEAPRLCPCGALLTGQASQRFCSTTCRKRASRMNPSRIAKKRESKSVTAMTIVTTLLSHRIESARRADGSLRDTFSDLPAPGLLERASRDSEEFNRRQAVRGRV